MKDPDAELKLALELAAKLGFIVVQEHYDEEHFGNMIIEMRNADMRLRFVQDRGELYCNVGPHSDPQWYPLNYLLAFANRGTTVAFGTVADQLRLFAARYGEFQSLLSAQGYSENVRSLEYFVRETSANLIEEIMNEPIGLNEPD